MLTRSVLSRALTASLFVMALGMAACDQNQQQAEQPGNPSATPSPQQGMAPSDTGTTPSPNANPPAQNSPPGAGGTSGSSGSPPSGQSR